MAGNRFNAMLKYTAGIFKIQTFLRATSAVKAEFYHRREAESGEFAGGPYARTAMFPIGRPLGEGIIPLNYFFTAIIIPVAQCCFVTIKSLLLSKYFTK